LSGDMLPDPELELVDELDLRNCIQDCERRQTRGIRPRTNLELEPESDVRSEATTDEGTDLELVDQAVVQAERARARIETQARPHASADGEVRRKGSRLLDFLDLLFDRGLLGRSGRFF